MSSILLSGGLRSSVNSLTDIGKQIETSNTRLSTGKKVNNALDNAGTYFLAKGFETESGNLKALLDNQNLALSTVSKATDVISQVTKLIQSVQALAKQAQSLVNTDATNRDALGTQIQGLLNQVDSITRDSSFNGSAIFGSGSGATTGTALSVVTNTAATAAAQTKVSVNAVDLSVNSAAGLNLSIAGNGFTFTVPALNATITEGTDGTKYAAGNFTAAAGDTKLAALVTGATAALVSLNVKGAAVATAGTILQVRQSFTTNTARTNQSANESLILADLNEEGAALTSLQTRQSFAVTSLQLAGQADKAILRLFG